MDLLTDLKQEQHFLTISIGYFGTKFRDEFKGGMFANTHIVKFDELRDLEKYIQECPLLLIPEVLLLEVGDDLLAIERFVTKIRDNPTTRGISIILLNFKANRNVVVKIFKPLVNDIYFYPFNVLNLKERLAFIFRFKMLQHESSLSNLGKSLVPYRIPLSKRIFDILVSSVLILLCSPILLLVAILIKLDSRGPIIYKSQRAGFGYQVFNFYKFRSMRVNADKELSKLSGLNQYAANGGQSAFVKINNDPRITRFGAFIRNTSIDELPQLFNVLIGDMSLVGNRPLPLYEAQMLTSDQWASRFLGPAGITGLWQVSKRGRSEMSDRERRELDNVYTQKFSFWMDLVILLRTIPALFQKESV
ncbi:sugar transferase [Parapedobacter sp. 2B3]|uniref:sugar transferase n=1 Tax=Parapedobacter sp. 2B3 TaxID=3342381 RepID=UPI0035B69833